MEAVKKSWMDSWVWHVAGWVAILGPTIFTLAFLVIGIVKAAKGRGHDLWMSMAAAFAVAVAIRVAIA
jgi:hypothetical protein